MYLFPIWAIISFFAIQQIYLNQNLNKTKIVFSLLSGIFLIYSSYSSIIRGTVFNITDWFVMVHNAVEAFAYKGGGYIFLVFTLIILMLISICFMKRWSIKYINILLMIFFIVNSVICFNGINQTQNRLLLNNSIVNEIKDKYDKVFIKKDSISQQDYYINFWELRDIFVEYDEEGLFELQNGDVIITSQKLPLEVLYSYKSSYLYKYAEYGVHIDQVFPNTIKVGEKFNIQKSGRSALAIKGRGFIPGCYVIINGTKIETTYGSPELLSISLEQSFYDKEGELKVQVVFKDTIKSNEIIIPIN